MTEREELFNDICLFISDEDVRNRLYIMLDKYEISKRETAVALLHEDRNEYLLKSFIVAKTVKGCTQRTLRCYKQTIMSFVNRIKKTIDDITTEDIRLYIAKRLYQDKVSKTTVGNEIRNLKSFFGYLHTEELILKNPMLRIESIKSDKIKKEAFTEMELERMRSYIDTKRERAIFEILLSTGCRVTELVNIKLTDIESNEILVHGKGNKDRKVYLNAKAVFALEGYLKERNDTNPYLFPGGEFMTIHKGAKLKHEALREWYKNTSLVNETLPIGTSSVEQMIRKLGKKAGVMAHPHKFRRTCATFALRRGMPIEQVSKMLGHESIQTTQIYLDLSEQDLKEAHRKFVI